MRVPCTPAREQATLTRLAKPRHPLPAELGEGLRPPPFARLLQRDCSCKHRPNNLIGISAHLIPAHPNNFNPLSSHPRVTLNVRFPSTHMSRAVKLNNQRGRSAVEIGNIRTQGMLPSENHPEPASLAPQDVPDDPLRKRGVSPKFTSKRHCAWRRPCRLVVHPFTFGRNATRDRSLPSPSPSSAGRRCPRLCEGG